MPFIVQKNIVNRLVGEFTIPHAKLEAVGLGFHDPIVGNNSIAARAQNRRVELVLATSVQGELVINKKQEIAQVLANRAD